jgi:hypothetical protein
VEHGTSWGGTNLSATITPSSTNSKILVVINQPCVVFTRGDEAGGAGAMRLLRGGTVIYQPNANVLFSAEANQAENERASNLASIQFLDSPETTSGVNYSTQAFSSTGTAEFYTNAGYKNSPAGVSSSLSIITLYEIYYP